MDRKLGFSLGSLVALLALAPSVSAAVFDSISKSMGTAWNAVGAIFSFQYVSGSPVIQEGIMKFLIFIMLLAVVQRALKHLGSKTNAKGETGPEWLSDNKTSGIIAFVVAATTVIFTPNVFIFSAIILLLVPVALALLGWSWSVSKMKENPWYSTLILFILLILLEFLDGNVYVAGNIAIGKMYPFTQQVMAILILVTSILFVWKLFSAIFTIGKGINKESIANARELLDTPLIARAPGRPREVAFALKEPGSVRVTWSDPVEGEKVVRYWIQHRYGDVTVGWNTIEKNRPHGQPHELIVSAIEKTTLDVTRPMQFRVCASGRNTPGGYGEWAYSEVRAPKEAPTRPLSASENEGEDEKNPPTPEEEAEKEPPQPATPTMSLPTATSSPAPIAPAVNPPPQPPAPTTPLPGTVTPGTAPPQGTESPEWKNADLLEDNLKNLVENIKKKGLDPQTGVKWTDADVTALLRTFVDRVQKYKTMLAKSLAYHHPQDVAAFTKAVDANLQIITAYCDGKLPPEQSFHVVLEAIARLQGVLEQALNEHETWMESDIAAGHVKKKNIERHREKYAKHRKTYEEAFALLKQLDPQLQIPALPAPGGPSTSSAKHFDVLTSRRELYHRLGDALWYGFDEIQKFRTQAGIPRDEETDVLYLKYVEMVAHFFAGINRSEKLVNVEYNGMRDHCFRGSAIQFNEALWNEAIRDVLAIENEEDIEPFIRPILIPPGPTEQERDNIGNLRKDIDAAKGMLSDALIESILKDFEWFLSKDYLFEQYTTKETQEELKRELGAVGELLGKGDAAKPEVRQRIMGLHTRLREAMIVAHNTIRASVKRKRAKDKRATLLRHQKWVTDIQERLEKIDRLLHGGA